MKCLMNRDQLRTLVANARWFDCYYVRSKEILKGIWRVDTNYPLNGYLDSKQAREGVRKETAE